MRKLIFQMSVSLDGYFEAENKSLDWHQVDEEFNAHAIEALNNTDYLIFGRTTYQLMKGAWTDPEMIKDDPVVAERMNNIPKIVISRTLDKVDWNDSRLIKENIIEEIIKLKQQPGKDLGIGGSNLAKTFIEHNLIDEFRFIYTPILLGKGHSIFEGLKDRVKLKLVNVKPFKSGSVIHYYEPLKTNN